MIKYTNLTRSTARGACFMVVLALAAAPVSAQWSAYGYGVAERDTKETLLLLAGIGAGPGGPGWSPTVGLQGYRLTYDGGASDVTAHSVKPSVGLRYGFPAGSVGFTVGYAFVSKDQVVPPGVVVADSKDGVVVTGSLDYSGTGGPLASQTLTSYNFGSSSLWARQRFTTRVAGSESTGQFRGGPEVAFNRGSGFSATQAGLIFQWQNPRFTIGAGVGRTLVSDADDATYYKVEFGMPLFR